MRKASIVAGALSFFVVGGIVGLFVGRQQDSGTLRQVAQSDLMQGYALLREADSAQRHGEQSSAQTWSAEGTAYLFSAIKPLSHLGISGMNAVAPYIQRAQYDFIEGHASKHQKVVLQEFQKSLSGLDHATYGDIPVSTLRSAIARVTTVIAR